MVVSGIKRNLYKKYVSYRNVMYNIKYCTLNDLRLVTNYV